MNIDILDYEITIDGKVLRFPMSYEEVKSVMGEASRILIENRRTLYMYDDHGLFCIQTEDLADLVMQVSDLIAVALLTEAAEIVKILSDL